LLGLLAEAEGDGATIPRGLGITEQRATDSLTEGIDGVLTARATEYTAHPAQGTAINAVMFIVMCGASVL
jgi:hypothetical protein